MSEEAEQTSLFIIANYQSIQENKNDSIISERSLKAEN